MIQKHKVKTSPFFSPKYFADNARAYWDPNIAKKAKSITTEDIYFYVVYLPEEEVDTFQFIPNLKENNEKSNV